MRGRRGGRGHQNYGGGGRGDGAIVVGRVQMPVDLVGHVSQGFGRGRGRGHVFRRAPTIIPVVVPPHVAAVNDPLLQQQHVPFVSPRCPRCSRLPLPGEVNIGSADEMLRFGLGLMALTSVGAEATNKTRFRAHYGIGPEAIFAMYNELRQMRDDLVVDCCSLLMAMNFLKCYETEPCMASRWGLSEERIRIKVPREYVRFIQQMKIEKVSQSIIFLPTCNSFASPTSISFLLDCLGWVRGRDPHHLCRWGTLSYKRTKDA